MTTSRAGTHTEIHDPHVVEWVVGILSSLLVAALIGWIGWKAMTSSPESPELVTRIVTMVPVADGYRVEFEVANRADTTAAAVVIRGEARDADIRAAVEVTFDYVPAHSASKGAMIFSSEAARAGLSISAIGYTEP